MKNNMTIANLERLFLSNKRILNVEELSRYTGFSTSWIYKLVAAGKIPYSKPNNKLIFFERTAIEEYLLSNQVSLADDVEQTAIDYLTAKPWKGGSI